jgi:gliding motility-associated protein GldE
MLILLIGSALVSGSEVAYFSLSPNDLERLEQDEHDSSRRILWLLSQKDKLLATILISNNFINIALVLLSEVVLSKILPVSSMLAWVTSWQNSWSWLQSYDANNIAQLSHFTITVVGITFLLVLFGEVTPKVYATINSIKLARFMSGPISLANQAFSGLSQLLVSWSIRMEKGLAAKQAAVGLTSKEDIGEAIELTVSLEANSAQDLDILKRIVKFPEVNVRQIMRARVDVIYFSETATYSEVLLTIRESGFSRFPVYEKESDNVIGILYAKDLLIYLSNDADFVWQDLIRTNVLFVPESKKINDLLRDFQLERLHMAVVVDEYGGTAGIVTLEDVLEEVIGEIRDEFDDDPGVIFNKIDDRNYIFDGKTMLNDVCRIMDIDMSSFDQIKGESESLAGLMLERLGRMPKKDQEVKIPNFCLKAQVIGVRRIEKILITILLEED